MTAKAKMPSKEWLEQELLLPPRGKGRGTPDIGKECGVSSTTVLRWLKRYGIEYEGAVERNSHHGKKKRSDRKKICPDGEEFTNLYLMPPNGEGKSWRELSKIYNVSFYVLRRWAKELGIWQTFEERHSQRMAGEGNPAYTNGESDNYQRNVLRRSSKPKKCIWCKTTKKLQIHHADHNRKNGDISNLEWLCGPCNRLEADLWMLSDRIEYEIFEEDGIVTGINVKFKKE